MIIKAEAVQCPRCLDIIVSRHQHDLHTCSCGSTAVDGGREYLRVLYDDQYRPPCRCFVRVDEADLMNGTGIFPMELPVEPETTVDCPT
jgi:hypothetical protein